jgi:hypothetical protein
MTPRVKQIIREHLEVIGGVSSYPENERFKYLSALITFVIELEELGFLDKIKVIYPYLRFGNEKLSGFPLNTKIKNN